MIAAPHYVDPACELHARWPGMSGRGSAMAVSGNPNFMEHLVELRNRLLRTALVFLALFGLALYFTPDLLKLLIAPYGAQLKVIGPTESITAWLQVALSSAAALALPYALVELWAFVTPGLLPKERAFIGWMIPAGLGLFTLGAAFAWFLMIPAAIQFLAGFSPEIFKTEWTSQNYIPFVTSLLFWIGLCFELPLLVFVLARLGIVTAGLLIRVWRFAVVGIVAIAAVITPTVDPFNLALVSVPLIALYFVSILLALVAGRGRARAALPGKTPAGRKK
ncbi:MAG: twin-arginine translocase subunit TatC [Spirochaetota bacterium]